METSNEENLLSIYLLSKQIEKSIKKCEYFSYHLGRCKQDSDKVKITSLLTAHTIYAESLIMSLGRVYKSILNSLLL